MKIYDCFMYYDEDLLLDLRLNILDKYVEFFVIVESKFYHKGKKRNLKFQVKNFEKFKNKIIYISQENEPKGILKINENDRLYFNGLSEGNYIKITSLSGEKIVEIETEAGGFNWNLTSSKGIKINPGIYLIFLISEIGEEGLITKVLVL